MAFFCIIECNPSVELLIQVNGQLCRNVCSDVSRNNLSIICSWRSNTGEHRIMLNITNIQRYTCSLVISPTCPPTTMTNCIQSTHTKEMSTAVGTVTTMPASGGAESNSSPRTTCNNSLVILGAFIGVLAALLVAVTTGWIVTCVLNTRKNKALTTRY